MRTSPFSLLALFFALAFSLSTWLEPRFQAWAGSRTKSSDILTVALGDSRRLFAKHFYVKADAYFHSGYYPTIFDTSSRPTTLHMGSSQSGRHEEEANFLGEPRDWIDRFSRHFFPSTHRHLGEDDCCEHHKHGEKCAHSERSSGEERELLPWLKLSAELDPNQPQTYVIAAFWLRSRLNKVDEAEQFLRAGLQANPGNAEILFELGRIYYENRKQNDRARNVWELALKKWREEQVKHAEQDLLLYDQLIGNLARLEEQEKNYSQALTYLEALKVVSPSKADIEKWIQEVRAKSAAR